MSGGRPLSINPAEARRLRDKGFSYPEIGRILGCHHSTAMYACDDYYRARKRKQMREYQRGVRAGG